MKRVFAIALSVCLLTSLLVFPASAETETSGTCGDNLTWTLDTERNILTISGTGPMYDYSEENPAPWRNTFLNTCIMEDGITTIGDYAFYKGSYAIIHVPATVTEIGNKAISYNNHYVYFYGCAPIIADDAFEGVTSTFKYVFGWEETDLKGYGGKVTWVQAPLSLSAPPKTVYSIGEPIKAEDFPLAAEFRASWDTSTYIPQSFQTEAYDNSTCGEKSVIIIADTFEFTHTYFVSDNQNHLDLVKVKVPTVHYYTGKPIYAEPVVTAGNLILAKDTHYTLSYQNNTDVCSNAAVTVTGIGEWAGFEKTVFFSILKQDISGVTTYMNTATHGFISAPLAPDCTLYLDTRQLTEAVDFVLMEENNINIGTASYHAVGIGGYYGSKEGTYQIGNGYQKITLPGAYRGSASSTLNDDFYYHEAVISPGQFVGWIDCTVNHLTRDHYAYYELYQIVDGEPVLVTTVETDYGYFNKTEFSYDFSSVYEEAAEEGGAIYMLSYTWLDCFNSVYSGILALYIPAKVPDATAMEVAHLENDGDYSKAYLTAYGVDGNIGDVTWTSSDPSVATVDDGVVTLIKPGTFTITAQYGDLIVTIPSEVAGRSMTECDFFHFDTQEEAAYVSCEHILMRVGTDYTCTVSSDGEVTEVTLTGKGLFSGQLVLQLDAETGEPLSHAHGFDSLCDETCNRCEYTRQAAEHTPAESWTKNQTHHWHACTACGAKTDEAEHTLSPEDSEVCTVCGTLYIPGDIDGNMLVNRDDVVQLLLHVSMPDAFPIEVDADFTGDGTVNRDDVVQLLLHVSMPDAFPLPA